MEADYPIVNRFPVTKRGQRRPRVGRATENVSFIPVPRKTCARTKRSLSAFGGRIGCRLSTGARLLAVTLSQDDDLTIITEITSVTEALRYESLAVKVR